MAKLPKIYQAQMAELVYAHDSKSCEETLEGSSPSLGTSIKLSDFWPRRLAALRAAESVGQKSESLILVELYNSARTFFDKN